MNIFVIQKDITTLIVDAIVNAAKIALSVMHCYEEHFDKIIAALFSEKDVEIYKTVFNSDLFDF